MQSTGSKKIRKGDRVCVIAGNARGQYGNVVACQGDRLVIEGINLCKKHVKRSQANPQGGIVEVERPIHVSNVALCNEAGVPVKAKVRTNESGERELVYEKEGQPEVLRTIKRAKK